MNYTHDIMKTSGTEDLDYLQEKAYAYGIPLEDVLFIDLNRQGVITDIPHERIRFYFKLINDPRFKESNERGVKDYFFGLPTPELDSDYALSGGKILLRGKEIGAVNDVQNDTCDSTYPRREGTVLNLNIKSKSTCHGCAFCHTFKQTPRDLYGKEKSPKELTEILVKEWLEKYSRQDLSYLYRLDILTGCFGGEEELVKSLFDVRETFSKYRYRGEIFYFGSEITSKQAFDKLEAIKPFGFCLSLECFSNREKLLKKHKANITLEDAKQILATSKDKGFGTQFSYVLGLEPKEIVVEGMEEFLSLVNRLPVINVFQPHTMEQRKLLVQEARSLDYFLDIRKEMERIFGPTGYRPRTWGNYRCLWYLKFANEKLEGSRLP